MPAPEPEPEQMLEASGRAVTLAEREPYDAGLLDACRRQWRGGEWTALAGRSIEQIEHHPQRARLALMMASAHQVLGQMSQARALIGLARQWGCDERLIRRVLVSGVHTVLGRATAAGGRLRDQAMLHFRDAMAPSGIAATGRAVVQQRVQVELEGMGLGLQAQKWLVGANAVQALPLGVSGPAAQPADKGRDPAARIDQLGRTLEKTIQKELGNAVRQIEAYANLQGYLSSGELLPALHGWPVSADFALLLVEILERQAFDAVVEFGSGSSTLLVARTLARVAARHGTSPCQIAFEHLARYHAETARLLEGAGLRATVHLELAPLVPFRAATGDDFQYYDVRAGLAHLQEGMASIANPRVLVIVDGPPEATGPLARYPALEVLLAALPRHRGWLLLDDYRREGEQETARRWQSLLRERHIEPVVTEYALEKKACLIAYDTGATQVHS